MPLGSGLNGTAWTMRSYDDGTGSSLFVGGYFLESPTGDIPLAKWGPCESAPNCAADFNRDGMVDGDDLGALLGSWGACVACAADLDADGTVDGDDLGSLLGEWGPCPQ